MSENTLQQNIVELMGINSLSQDEQEAFLQDAGSVILETALLRLITSLSEDEQQALEQYVDTDPEPLVLLQHLVEHYANFGTILEEVVIEFKEDALAVLE